MAKGLFGGMTDYSHQSFNDILKDLEAEEKNTRAFRDEIQDNIDQLIAVNYWNSSVPIDFKNIIAYAMRHFDTTIAELEEIRKDLLIEVKQHHVNRLQKITNVAQEINVEIGQVWHKQYNNKEYGNKNFRIVESIYGDTRDMAVNLLDNANVAERLQDFIGRTNQKVAPSKKNKWERPHKIALASLIVAIIVLLFGNNLYDRFTKTSSPKNIDSIKVSGLNQDTILQEKELPYLENYAIIDKGLYVKYYYNSFVFGGVNVDTVRINAISVTSEAIRLKKYNDTISMDINSEPYIEFEYKGKYYSIEVKGKHYTFTMTLKQLVSPTLNLRKYKEL